MSGINRVVLVGRIATDLQLKKTQSGVSVASYRVAVDRKYKTQGGEDADFINCVSWRQNADFITAYATKGSQVGIEGSIQTRSFLGSDGKKVYVTEVITDSVQLLEPREVNQARMNQNAQAQYQGQQQYQAPQYNAQQPSYQVPQYTAQQPQYNAQQPQHNAQQQTQYRQQASWGAENNFDTGQPIDINTEDLPF